MSDTMMPDKMNWDDIRALYRKARQCFTVPRKAFHNRSAIRTKAGSIFGGPIIMLRRQANRTPIILCTPEFLR